MQKHAKQLKCDVNSKQFKDVMRYLWLPRLRERIRAANPGSTAVHHSLAARAGGDQTAHSGSELGQQLLQLDRSPASSGGPVSSFDSASVGTHPSSSVTVTASEDKACDGTQAGQYSDCEYWSNCMEPLPSPCGYPNLGLPEFDWWPSEDLSENLWSMEDNWLIQHQQL